MFKRRHILSLLAATCLFSPQVYAGSQLELEQAYEQVLDQSPQVRAYHAKIAAAEGNRIQQSLMPNPEAVFEVENFAGDDAMSGFDGAEYTIGVQQQLEIGGKRSRREDVADIEKQQVGQDALAAVQVLLAQTNAAYMRVAIAQERLAQADKRAVLADKMHDAVKRRISAAKASDIQHTKADLEVSAAKVEQSKAKNELSLAKATLANLMGQPSLEQSVTADLKQLSDPPEYEALMLALENTPVSVMSQLSIQREESALGLARAESLPDPTVGLGVRRFNEEGSTAFLASVSIPLTIFNRNQGRIREAEANLRAAEADQDVLRLSLNKEADELWQTLASAREEVLSYQDGLLPSAEKAYAQADDGFDQGAFTFLDLLDAQRTLFDMQKGHLDALTVFHETKAKLDMLGGAYADLAAAAFDTTPLEN